VSCTDSDNPTSYDAWWEAAQLFPTYFAPLWTYASSACAAWPGTQDDRYPGPFTAWTSNPVLVVNTLFDPATRYEGALQVRSLLPNSSLVKVHGWGHTTLFYSEDADAAVSGYLLSGTPPPDGVLFDQDYVPFQAPAAQSGTPSRPASWEEITWSLRPAPR
jgi:hypothetical protein